MRRRVAMSLLALAVAAFAEAQTLPSSPAFDAGREQLSAGNLLEAAGAFHQALLDVAPGGYSLGVAVYCDVANLERHVRAAGNPPGLFVVRRSVGGRPCLGLYWGLFASRDAARAARPSVPVSLRAPGQAPVALSAILPPGEPPPMPAAAPPAATAERALPPAAMAEPEPESLAPSVTEPEPLAPPPVFRESPLLPAPAPDGGARVPAMELAAGYSTLWDTWFSRDGADGFYPRGFHISLCANLNRSLGVVGEVSGHYDSNEVADVLGTPLATFDRDLLGVHAGPRFTHRGGGIVAPYVQALAGWTRTGFDLLGQREVEDSFSIQPGVGLQLGLSRSVGLGLGADYRRVFGAGQSRNELRLHADLVFGIGDR